MKKKLILFLTTALIFATTGCSDDSSNIVKSNDNNEQKTETIDEKNKDDVKVDKDTEDKWGKDYLELGIGDTGIVHNNHSKFEVTLNSVEITEKKGAHTSDVGVFVIPNITVKNIGDSTILGDDIMSSIVLTDEPGTPGYAAVYLDGVFNGWPEEIKPQESKSVDVVFDEIKNNVYALQFGHAFESVSNEVRFIFNQNEAE